MDKYLRPSTSSSDAKPKPAKRKYDNSYLELGFIENSDGRPKWVVFLQVLANEAMKPAKLKRHLITKHPEFKDKRKYFLWRKSEEYMQKTRLVNLATTSEKAQRASYLVAQRIAKSKIQIKAQSALNRGKKRSSEVYNQLIIPTARGQCHKSGLYHDRKRK
ncbi:zinc finger BED domain-containing protein 5-like [Scomber scombrus]|uniref:Zinc finger BED domain-containing protein 5-like n=1 Tax=Scomber scombrus TaxID=13677 RepID=A0AAV1PRS6_SCOSC